MASISPLDKAPLAIIRLPRNIQLEEKIAKLKQENKGIRRNFSYPDIKIVSHFHGMDDDRYSEKLEFYLDPEFNSWPNKEIRFVDLNLLEKRVHDNTRFEKVIEDLRDTGTIYPIHLNFNYEDNSYNVVDGLHRIATCKLFGYRMIPAVVDFECFYHPNNGFENSFRKFEDSDYSSEDSDYTSDN